MARKRVTERRRESCHSLSPSCAPAPAPFPSARLAVLATPCSGGERLLKPCPGLHVWTQLLLLPRQQMAGNRWLFGPRVGAAAS